MTGNPPPLVGGSKKGDNTRKRVIAACIDLTLEFDGVSEYDNYTDGIRAKKQDFNVLEYNELSDGKIRVRLQRKYNNSPFPGEERKGGEE